MFFDMHADLWTDNLWEYEKGKNDVIRRKYKDRFIEGGVLRIRSLKKLSSEAFVQ